MVEVDAVGSLHVVSVAWVGEEIGVGAGIDAGSNEGEGVLRYAGWVVASIDYQ